MMYQIRIWTAFIFILSLFLAAFSGCVPAESDGCGSSNDGSNSSGSSSSSSSGGVAEGDIEDEYALSGPYTAAKMSVTGFTIYYPGQMDDEHPIITWGNGTGAPTIGYSPLLRHLASWGFVVIASNSTMTQSGEDMIAGVDYLLEQNQKPDSTFYGKLDVKSIGTTGHSQGGGGAINSAKDPRVKCTLPIAPAPGQIGQVQGPIFLIAGSADTIVSASLVRSMCYNLAKAPTIFGIVNGMGHLDFLGNFGKARGYITAWFMYQLKNDNNAAQAFVGSCEICNNPDWTVVKKNF